MLEAKLNLKPALGPSELPAPKSFEQLQEEYLLAGSMKVISSVGYDHSKDLEKVITLRPNSATRYITANGQGSHKGYFAWGSKKENDQFITFKFYAPFPSVKKNFPPKALKECVALFLARLNDEGYIIPSRSINYRKII